VVFFQHGADPPVGGLFIGLTLMYICAAGRHLTL
jgi:hypothetical protein